ncbi:DUF945 family protein [Carnimonas bestiolae]|uniref:DUF945 family protein n=1 Tax=Carnimonas bestiolae TaxID=3402172 RepID=UPI003EDCA505
MTSSSKKLGITALVVIVIVAALYVFGMLYSRHLFFSHLDSVLDDLKQDQGITLEKKEVSKGFFSSTFTLEGTLAAEGESSMTLNAPLTAHHGIFSSSVDGHPALLVEGKKLFSEILQADQEPMVDANFSSLSGHYHVHIELPDSRIDNNGNTARTHDLRVNVDGNANKNHIESVLEWQQLSLKDLANNIVIGPGSLRLNVPNRDTLVGTNTHFELDNATIHKVLLGSVELKDLHYDDHYDKGDNGIDWHGEYHIGSVLHSDKEIGSGDVKLNIANLDEQALLSLVRRQANAVDSDEDDEARDTDAQRQRDIQRLLSNSPLLTIEHFEVKSPLLDKPITAKGHLQVNGDKVNSAPQQPANGRVFSVVAQQFAQYATGHITLTGLANILGGQSSNDNTELEFKDGQLTIDGQPVDGSALGGNPLDAAPLPSMP